MALRETDARTLFTHEVVLLDQPPIMKVPVLRAVENEIEPRFGRFLRLLGRAAESLGQKDRMRMPRPDVMNQAPPELLRHLVRRIAPEPFKPQRNQMFRHPETVLI